MPFILVMNVPKWESNETVKLLEIYETYEILWIVTRYNYFEKCKGVSKRSEMVF
jgi:hypothetical protein